mgnify:CR=1 FL=1
MEARTGEGGRLAFAGTRSSTKGCAAGVGAPHDAALHVPLHPTEPTSAADAPVVHLENLLLCLDHQAVVHTHLWRSMGAAGIGTGGGRGVVVGRQMSTV